MLCNVSSEKTRALVPSSMRRRVFSALHRPYHPRVMAMLKHFNSRFLWPEMNMDVRKWDKTSPRSQRAKVSRHTKAPLVVSAFLHLWVMLYGSPEPTTTDLGHQFKSFAFSAVSIPRFKEDPHYRLPSRFQWHDRTISPLVVGRYYVCVQPRRSIRQSSNGSSWHLRRRKRRPTHISFRASPRFFIATK